MEINLIVCIDKDNGIGKNNKIPWKFNIDLKYFTDLTSTSIIENKKNVVIMGKKTYDSIPNNYKPLKNRINLVLTKNTNNIDLLDLYYFNNIISILLYLDENKSKINNVWIIGGSEIYKQFLNLQIINNIYLTHIKNISYNCDTFFSLEPLKNFKLIDNKIKYDKNQYDKENKLIKLEFVHYKYINKNELKYLNYIQKILKKGIYKLDRTNIGTLSLFGKSFKYNIKNYRLPLFTHRKMFYRGIIEELLFFISGKTNTKILEGKKVNIWKGNTSREFLDSRNLSHLKEGDMGAGYSFQLRHFGAKYIDGETNYKGQGFDQLNYVINEIKNNPNSRRILFSYWNPSDLNKVALPSCFLKNTLILTKDGYKKIQNINLNDIVYTHKGNWETINNIQCKEYNNNIYQIECVYNNKYINATKEHPFYITNYIVVNSKITIAKNYQWCTAENLNPKTDLLCMPINNKDILHNLKLFNTNKLITLDHCYILGYYLKNGCIFNNKVFIYINKKNNKLYDLLNIYLYLNKENEILNNYYKYSINNKDWEIIFKELGSRVYNKKIPEWIQDLPKSHIMYFINGFNDGHDIKKRVIYKIISSNVAFGIQRLYAKLKIYMSLNYLFNKNSRKKYILSKLKNNVLIDNNFMYFPIKKIKKIYKNEYVYNFEVKNDNSYIVQNIAVHNCHILYQFHINPIKNELSCSFYQRSSDFVLAANFNIVSAAVLTFMLCHITGYSPGKIIHNIGDIHIYKNHIEETKKMLNNSPYNFPIFYINDPEKKIKHIEDFNYNDFKILLYNSYKKYSFTMAV